MDTINEKRQQKIIKEVWECKTCDCLTQHIKVCKGIKDMDSMSTPYYEAYIFAQSKHKRKW